jgi:LmbE family N-acetylglucosaminyl deacetylase
MSILIVVAHPDDEVLGCGATIASLTKQNIPARCCMLSGQAGARQSRPNLEDFSANINQAQSILGLPPPILGDFPNIQFNMVPHLTLVQFIEAAIVETGADIIFTHHPADLNNDHLHTSLACQTAARLFQRRPGLPPLKALYFMEILSSTEWTFPGGNVSLFEADTFFPVGDTLEQKIEAMHAYKGVMRNFPHPRSEEVIRGLAAYRGSQAGMVYAEAFQTAFHALGSLERWI